MQVVPRVLIGLLVVNLATVSSSASAATGLEGAIHSAAPTLPRGSGNPCEELVKECFAYTGEIFTNCLHVAGGHSFCAHSDLGELVSERWKMAPSGPALDNAPALLGPRMFDRNCIKRFDSQLSAHLGTATLTHEVIELLRKNLIACQQEPPNDLLRP